MSDKVSFLQLLIAQILGSLLIGIFSHLTAQNKPIEILAQPVVCYGGDALNDHFTPPPKHFLYRKGAKTGSLITVNYEGFTNEARTAFEYAVEIWEAEISSNVPIIINAEFTDLGGANQGSITLGQAGPFSFFMNVPGSPSNSIAYPVALANAIAGVDLSPNNPDIVTEFNSNAAVNWYFGLDGNPPSGQRDFVTVVLHELGHGLGFIGNTNGGAGVGNNNGTNPRIFDFFVETQNGTSITSLGFGTAAQVAALTSGAIFWGGEQGINRLNGDRPQLYAPSTFAAGSSFSHLDEATYNSSNVNRLMTPAIDNPIHDIGPATRGIFQDMGWTLAQVDSIDLSLFSISTQISECEFSDLTPIEIEVKNFGTVKIGNFEVAYIIRDAEENEVFSSSFIIEDSVESQESIIETVQVDISENGLYTIEASVILETDIEDINNTKSETFNNRKASQPASNIQFSNEQQNEMFISWESGNGDSRLVLVKANNDFLPEDLPVNGVTYQVSSLFGTGTPIGSAFPVTRSAVTGLLVRGLQPGITYFVAVVEYSCDPPQYLLDDITFASNTLTDIEEDQLAQSIEIFPNPVSDKINVSFKSIYFQDLKLKLYDVQGHLHREYELRKNGRNLDNQLYLDKLSPGMYFMRIVNENGVSVVKKIIIN